jgi:hypothetical protein
MPKPTQHNDPRLMRHGTPPPSDIIPYTPGKRPLEVMFSQGEINAMARLTPKQTLWALWSPRS